MDIFRLESVSPITKEPVNEGDFKTWIEQREVIPFLEREIEDKDIIIYASLPFAFIHAVLVQNVRLEKETIDDLLLWDSNPFSTWGLVASSEDAWIEGPLKGNQSKILREGEQIIFIRGFEGVDTLRRYYEIEQKISHVLGLHFMPERNAWCRLDQHGDIEDVVKIIELNELPKKESGTIVTFRRSALGEFTSLCNYTLCRMFDFTRYKKGSFSGWRGSNQAIPFENGTDIFGTLVVEKGNGSYSRGIQVKNISVSKEEIVNKAWGRSQSEESRQYVTFIAQDWKNKKIAEISCDPSCLANYFMESELPFELTPAFFRPEVLLKYKSDRDKYQLEERSIGCRGSWYLETFDVNEAGQVHTYLGYLNRLPYEEQLHWKQYNETPKAPLSRRTIATDFRGQWYEEYNPLSSLKNKLSDLHRDDVGWWTLRGEYTLEKVLYPFTSSPDEWADEILNLDQLIVEGFDEKWLKRKSTELGRNPDIKSRGLKLIEECLIGFGFDEDHAHSIMSPLHELHNLRSKLRGHASGDEAAELRKIALKKFGSYRQHYIDLCARCDESLGIIAQAFRA